MTQVQPGDILAVRSPGLGPRFIRFGAAVKELLTGNPEPNLDSHIAVAHHTDQAGTLWVLEGRPGGVGWRDARDYLRSPWTVTNIGQPKTTRQRDTVCRGAAALIGTSYDWAGIVADAAGAFGLADVWQPGWAAGQVPGHFVCSSLAAWLYRKAGLTCPADAGRETTPADWLDLILTHHWQEPA